LTAGSRAALAVVVGAYLILGAGYALRTPLWQVPDEPAHYNYVAQVARSPADPPEIAPGDYPHDELEALKAERFPAGRPIDGLRYEDHQPPAYYYLAATAFALAGGGEARRVLAIRLFGVLLGAVTVVLAWAVAREAVPDDPRVAAATAGFVAFLPMHLAMSAAVNNDPLADVVMGATLFLGVRRVRGRVPAGRFAALGGLLVGLAFLTKATIYPAAVLLAAAEILGWRRRPAGRSARAALGTVARVWAIGLAIGLPWFARNAVRYGGLDVLGLGAHDRVVVGQPRTADWAAAHGWADLAGRLVTFTFESFWGVFGWMGVFLDARIYQALGAASLGAALGLALALGALARSAAAEAAGERAALAFLGLATATCVAGFLWYNLGFVQHQGRYLFPALIPIALGFTLGVRELARRAAAGAGLGAHAGALEAVALAGFDAALAGLAFLSLERYIVPGLS